jgi:hypothetical protein
VYNHKYNTSNVDNNNRSIAHYPWSPDKPKLFKSGTVGSEAAADRTTGCISIGREQIIVVGKKLKRFTGYCRGSERAGDARREGTKRMTTQ